MVIASSAPGGFTMTSQPATTPAMIAPQRRSVSAIAIMAALPASTEPVR